MVDRSNQYIGGKELGGEIEALSNCIQYMDELGNFSSMNEMLLSIKVSMQAKVIEELKTVNLDLNKIANKLQERLDSIYRNRMDITKLYPVLFEEENL